MRYAAALATAFIVLLAAPGAQARVRCTSGATMYLDGQLRIFAMPFHPVSEFEGRGYDEYACLGGRGRPLHVALDVGGGEGERDTYRYVFAGGRYLGVATVDIGENGGARGAQGHGKRPPPPGRRGPPPLGFAPHPPPALHPPRRLLPAGVFPPPRAPSPH